METSGARNEGATVRSWNAGSGKKFCGGSAGTAGQVHLAVLQRAIHRAAIPRRLHHLAGLLVDGAAAVLVRRFAGQRAELDDDFTAPVVAVARLAGDARRTARIAVQVGRATLGAIRPRA